MKKYYLISLCYDHGYWSETHQDFKGFLYATKYEHDPSDVMYWAISEFKKAVAMKPCKIEEVWYNE